MSDPNKPGEVLTAATVVCAASLSFLAACAMLGFLLAILFGIA